MLLSSPTRCAAITLCVAISLIVRSSALAGKYGPLEEAAREHRDSVQTFERLVHGLRYLNRFDVRLVERLEDASREFYGASFHLNEGPRVLYHWSEIQSLQPRIAEAIFGRGCYPENLALAQCWERVMAAYLELALQLDLIVTPIHLYPATPIHGHVGHTHAPARTQPTISVRRTTSAGREVRPERAVGLHGVFFR